MAVQFLPIIIAVASSGLIAGAIIYFFVSNSANQKRTEYMTQVNEVFELLQRKVSKLKALIKNKDETILDLENANKEKDEKIETLKTDNKTLKSDLDAAELEKERYAQEIEKWKEMHQKALAGFSAPMYAGAVTFLKSSPILKESKYRPKRVFEYLRNRKAELTTEIETLS